MDTGTNSTPAPPPEASPAHPGHFAWIKRIANDLIHKGHLKINTDIEQGGPIIETKDTK